jgi:hypothetical protein
MDAATIFQHRYESPRVTDYGTLAELTADAMMLAPFGTGTDAVSGIVPPLVPPETPDVPGGPGGGGGGVQGAFEVPDAGAIGEAAPELGGPGESVPAGTEAEGGGGGGGAGGGGGGGGPVETGGGAPSLPFTGFAAAGVAGVGTLLAGAGAALRRALRRRRDWR